MPKIVSVKALEILDSRGRPTVKAYMELEGEYFSSASVPSGASTGRSEALELRDGESRYQGLGCSKAVSNINGIINSRLAGIRFDSQASLDQSLIDLDGTENKSNLGANALLAVSLAFSRVFAKFKKQPLHLYFSEMAGTRPEFMPRPTINLFSGGIHAGGQIPIQDLLIIPTQKSTAGVLECAYAVYQKAAELCQKKYRMRSLTADEGGLAPPFSTIESMFNDGLQSIEQAGYSPGKEVFLAVDLASSQFYRDEKYFLGERQYDAAEMIDLLEHWVNDYPIISLEDGLSENDWDNWPVLCRRIGEKSLVMGDDLLCTNPDRIEKAVQTGAANALLLKANQIGSISEALVSLDKARQAGWHVTASARSGETEDHWLSDLAMGWQAEHIKIGSITQSERLSKYNRLLEIEQECRLPVGK